VHHEVLDATSLEASFDKHHLAEARMESIRDLNFGRVFVGSMSPFRAGSGPHAY